MPDDRRDQRVATLRAAYRHRRLTVERAPRERSGRRSAPTVVAGRQRRRRRHAAHVRAAWLEHAVNTVLLSPEPSIALRTYLQLLGGDGQGWLEVRYRTRRGMRALFYPARGRSRQLANMIGNVSRRSDVYVGCAIRRTRDGHKDAVAGSWVAWAEFDTPEALDRLATFALQPTMLLSSGTPVTCTPTGRWPNVPTSTRSRTPTADSRTPSAATRCALTPVASCVRPAL